MIKRTILKYIEQAISCRPVTLITGARQVGKSTIAQLFIEKGFSYVSLDNSRERDIAIKDPELFLQLHKWPLIIDEVQRAPGLFDAIEEIVNNEKRVNIHNYGMYILTGSQIYKLMNNVTQSMAGRIAIVHMSPLSRNEIINREEKIFDLNVENIHHRAKQNPLKIDDLYKNIIKGFYPEIYVNKDLTYEMFYTDYIETYIERDVSEIINIKDKFAFRQFMEFLASLTGQELIYSNISNSLGIDIKTVQSWVSVLLAGDIIYLLEPYSETSIKKRIVKRPKIYFSDTGLACFLAKVNSPEMLKASFLNGRFVETYIINEIRKTYLNNGKRPNFYYYRDTKMNEIDLLILEDGKLFRIECKAGINYNLRDIKAFECVSKTNYILGTSGIICNSDTIYPLSKDIYVFPLAGI